MTIPLSYARNVATGNGVAIGFATSIQIKAPTDLKIYWIVDGVKIPKNYPADYDVLITTPGFAMVTFNVAPPSGSIIVFYRQTPSIQATDFVTGSVLKAQTIEDALDRLVLRIQEIDDRVARAIALDDTVDWVAPPKPDFPPPAANRLLVGKLDGSGWENRLLSELGGVPLLVPVAVSDGGTGATTPAAARLNLGIGNASLVWTAEQLFPTQTHVGYSDTSSDPGVLVVGNANSTSTLTGRIQGIAKNTGGGQFTPCRIDLGRGSDTPGSESGWVEIVNRRAGVPTREVLVDGGLVVGSPSGGAMGLGTVNAAEYYKDGALLSFPVTGGLSDIPISNPDFEYSASHGLSAPPSIYEAYLRCTSPEHGYSTGDRVTFTASNGLTIWANSTNIGIIVDGNLRIRHKTTGAAVTASASNWTMLFRWIRFFL